MQGIYIQCTKQSSLTVQWNRIKKNCVLPILDIALKLGHCKLTVTDVNIDICCTVSVTYVTPMLRH